MTIRKKLVRNFFIQNFLGLLATLYIYITRITSSIKFANQSIPERYWKNNEPFILAFWHSQLMMIAFSGMMKKESEYQKVEQVVTKYKTIMGIVSQILSTLYLRVRM